MHKNIESSLNFEDNTCKSKVADASLNPQEI